MSTCKLVKKTAICGSLYWLLSFIFWFIPAHWNSQDNLCIGNLGEKVGLLEGCVELFFFFKLVGHYLYYISDHNAMFLPGIT
jgi:hypothetical protein